MDNINYVLSTAILLNILFYLIGVLIFIYLLRVALRINQRTELQIKQNKLLGLVAEKLGISKEDINELI